MSALKSGADWRKRLERASLALAATGVAAGLWLGLHERSLLSAGLGWGWAMTVLLLGVPLIMIANAWRLALCFRLTGERRPIWFLLRASILSGAANMLPLPGGAMVRVAYLRSAQTPLVRATGITLASAAAWFALASVGSGAALILLDNRTVGGALLLLGGALGVTGWSYMSTFNEGRRVYWLLILLESAVFVVQAFRFSWCFSAIGAPVQWLQGLALSVAYVAGAVVSVVPAGLGVVELTAVMIAPFAHLEPAATFLAVFLDRVCTMVGLLLAAGILAWRRQAAA